MIETRTLGMKSLLVALMILCAYFPCTADVFVAAPSPSGATSMTYYPFLLKQDPTYPNSYSMRYQQVFSSSLFTNLDSGLINIVTLAFIVEFTNRFAVVSWSVTNMQINLSTSARRVDGLSTNFSENTGPDDSVVFGPRQVDFREVAPGAQLVIHLDKPFRYNPALGNLLLDVKILNGSGPFDTLYPSLNAFSAPTDEVSRVWANSVL